MVLAVVVLFLILFIIYRVCRYYWNVYTGKWTTTMDYLKKDETCVGKRIIYVEMMSILYGKVEISGSMSSRDHQFTDERGNTITFGDPFYDDELILFTGAHGGKGLFDQNHSTGHSLTPCYWLDLVK